MFSASDARTTIKNSDLDRLTKYVTDKVKVRAKENADRHASYRHVSLVSHRYMVNELSNAGIEADELVNRLRALGYTANSRYDGEVNNSFTITAEW